MPATHAARPRLSARAWLGDRWLWLVAHMVGLYPLALMVWRYTQHELGVDPVRTLYTFTGRAAIVLLGLSLAATPVYIVSGWRKPLTVRRALGLYAFFYAVLHFANFIGLDYFFNLRQILQDALLDKPYIVAGLAALIILTALAVTSTRGWQRRLKRNWVRLHWLVYAAGVLAVLHFVWQAKIGAKGDPLLYGAILAALLLVRVPPIRHRIVLTRQGLTGQGRRAMPIAPRSESAPRPGPTRTGLSAPESHVEREGRPN